MPVRLRAAVRRLADALLTVVAVLGAACLVTVVLGPLVGVHAEFVRSGSMAPTVPTGSLALTHRVATSDVRPGDVVTVARPDGSRVTHRVVRRVGDELTLKGDANRVADPVRYDVTHVGRLVLHVPFVGYVAGWSTTPLGGVGIAAVALLLLGLAARRERPDPAPRRTTRGGAGVVGVALAVPALVGYAVLAPGAARPAWAGGFGDSVAVDAGTYTAAAVPAPTVTCGSLLVLSTTLTWSAVAGATGYRVHSGVGGATVTTVGPATLSTALTSVGSGTFWVEAVHAYAGVTWTSSPSNSRTYTVVAGVPGTCA